MMIQLVKLLDTNIVVHIYSYPHFAIETLLAFVVCIAHCLLIFEINNLYRRMNAKAAVKLRLKHPQLTKVENCSYHTILSRIHTRIFPIVPFYKRLNRKFSTATNFGWVIPTNHRVDHLLSLSPSEYVRKDKERKHREVGLRSCLQSLTSLLEKAFNDDIMMKSASGKAIKERINAIKEFENQFERDSIGDLCTPSLHSLLKHSVNQKSLKSSLVPHHFVIFSLCGDKIETRENYLQETEELA
ncbi:hypothetical protein JTB14_006363 [Gonioctena quinquepunctata]|nr:hypothetical protein JTB14_006363 [Gonioctena quinquepunctata]